MTIVQEMVDDIKYNTIPPVSCARVFELRAHHGATCIWLWRRVLLMKSGTPGVLYSIYTVKIVPPIICHGNTFSLRFFLNKHDYVTIKQINISESRRE